MKEIVYLTATFPKSDEPNSNGRIYPSEVIEEMNNQIQELIKRDRLLVYNGEALKIDNEMNCLVPGINDVVGKATNIKDNIVTIELMPGKFADVLKMINKERLSITPVAMGNRFGTVELDTYKFLGLSVGLKNDISVGYNQKGDIDG